MDVKKIFGPPGTGKTHSLLRIVEKLLAAGMSPERIGYATFTKRAQLEAIRRAAEKFNLPENAFPYFRTLHAMAYAQRKISAGQLIRGPDDLTDLAVRLSVEFKKGAPNAEWGGEFTSMNDGDMLLSFDHYRRHTLKTIEQAWRAWANDSDANIFHVRRFCREYKRYLDHHELFDFTSLLELPLSPLPIDVMILDEAQDLSVLQWQAFHSLSADAKKVYMAGDDDQAIYTWAGASPDAFLTHPASKSVVLSRSYRVPLAVQTVANHIVSRIKTRQQKIWRPREAVGLVRRAVDMESIVRSLKHTDDTLILYRNHVQGKVVEEVLREHGVSYTFADGKQPWARQWLPAVVAWERLRKGLAVSKKQAQSAISAIAAGRGVTKDTKDFVDRSSSESTFLMTALTQNGLTLKGPWFEALNKIAAQDVIYIRTVLRHHGVEGLIKTPLIRLSTIHGAKGAQADHVVLILDMTQKTRQSLEDHPDDERRVWYVGVTRAKDRLTLVGHDHPFIQ